MRVIISVRSAQKAQLAIDTVKREVPDYTATIEYVLLDLCDMDSIERVCIDLINRQRIDQFDIDYLFLNAGWADYIGVNYLLGVYDMLFVSFIRAVSLPVMLLERKGTKTPKDGMGKVFQANVFGHYYLLRRIVSAKVLDTHARVIWTTSLNSEAKKFNIEDPQCLDVVSPYEGSKRMIDILHLATYFSLPDQIEQYIVQPGICASNIVPVSSYTLFAWVHSNCMLAAFYIARWLGSPWHSANTYKGAVALLWCAVYRGDDLDQTLKYGSATNRWGREMILAHEVQDYSPMEGERLVEYMGELYDKWRKKLEKT